jgi:hypothetical protein
MELVMKQNQNVQSEVAKDKVDLSQFAVVNTGKEPAANSQSMDEVSAYQRSERETPSKNGLQKMMDQREHKVDPEVIP